MKKDHKFLIAGSWKKTKVHLEHMSRVWVGTWEFGVDPDEGFRVFRRL